MTPFPFQCFLYVRFFSQQMTISARHLVMKGNLKKSLIWCPIVRVTGSSVNSCRGSWCQNAQHLCRSAFFAEDFLKISIALLICLKGSPTCSWISKLLPCFCNDMELLLSSKLKTSEYFFRDPLPPAGEGCHVLPGGNPEPEKVCEGKEEVL